MELKYLWDTNTVIYYLQQQLPVHAERFIDKVLTSSPPTISAITEIELLCWRNATDRDLGILHSFIDDSLIIELLRPIKLKTASIRKQHKIKLADAIIAATAMVNNFTLVTRNTKDFREIKGLSITDPWM